MNCLSLEPFTEAMYWTWYPGQCLGFMGCEGRNHSGWMGVWASVLFSCGRGCESSGALRRLGASPGGGCNLSFGTSVAWELRQESYILLKSWVWSTCRMLAPKGRYFFCKRRLKCSTLTPLFGAPDSSLYLGFSAVSFLCFPSSLYAIFRFILCIDFLFIKRVCWLSGLSTVLFHYFPLLCAQAGPCVRGLHFLHFLPPSLSLAYAVPLSLQIPASSSLPV